MTHSGEPTAVVEVVTRCSDRAVVDRIAEVLVAERLAACVHVTGPGASTYRWKGSIEHTPEWELVAVTAAPLEATLTRRLLVLHSYELPALTVRTVSASSDYGRWVRESTVP